MDDFYKVHSSEHQGQCSATTAWQPKFVKYKVLSEVGVYNISDKLSKVIISEFIEKS